jgi:hypothetical protein
LQKHQTLVCALALILSACGGGGSSNDVEAALNLNDADVAVDQIAENAPAGSHIQDRRTR